MERDAPQSTPPATLCKAGCGFYGSPNFDSMCSKCFKEALKKKNQNPSQNDGGPVVEATSTEAMIIAPAHAERKDQESKTMVTTSVLREFEDQTDEVNDDDIDDADRNSDDDDTDDGSEGDDGTDDGSESDDQDMVDVDIDDDFSDDASDGVYDVNLHDFFDGEEGWAWLGEHILNANNGLEEDEDGQGEDADDVDGGRKRSSSAKVAGSPKKKKLDASPSGSPSPSSTSAALLGAASTTAAPPQPAANQSPAPIQSTSAGAVEASAGVSLPAALETGSPTIPVVTSAAAGSSSVAEASGGAEDGVVVAEAPAEEGDKDGKKPKKNRCHECRKKVGLTGFECRCGGLFCSLHRYSDKHQCTFDYHALGAEQIRKANPVVVSEKVQKI